MLPDNRRVRTPPHSSRRGEVGDRIMQGKEPVRFFEMNLKRVGDTNWPAAAAVNPK